jgi:hypothetical protein
MHDRLNYNPEVVEEVGAVKIIKIIENEDKPNKIVKNEDIGDEENSKDQKDQGESAKTSGKKRRLSVDGKGSYFKNSSPVVEFLDLKKSEIEDKKRIRQQKLDFEIRARAMELARSSTKCEEEIYNFKKAHKFL